MASLDLTALYTLKPHWLRCPSLPHGSTAGSFSVSPWGREQPARSALLLPPVSPRAGVYGVGVIPPQQLDFEKEASSCFYTSPGLFLSSLTSTKNATSICSETQQVITNSGLWDPYLWGCGFLVFFLLPSAPWYFLPLEGKKKKKKIVAGLSPLSKSLPHMKARKES